MAGPDATPETAGTSLAADARAEWTRYAAAVLETVNEAAMLLDRRGNVLSWNRAAERILGWSSGEIVGRSVEMLVPAERRADIQRVASEMQRRGRVAELDSEATARDGRRVPIRLSKTRIDDPNGACAGYALVLRDLSERRDLERQVLRADRLATIGLLASSVAHEVGTPLNVILGRAEMLAESLQGNDEAQRQIAAISAQIQRIAAVVARLLTFSREAAPGGAPVQLNRVVEEVLSLVELRSRAQHVEVTSRLDPELPVLTGSAGHFHQILLNLVMNSLDAMPEGGRLDVVTRVCAGGHLTSGPPLACRCIEMEVVDSGHGIAPENLSRVFEPFFTTKPGTKGTGLGLAITQELVRKYGGHIEVESVPHQETRFRLNFPHGPRPLQIVS